MKFSKLMVTVFLMCVTIVPAMADDSVLPADAKRVKRAIIEAMTDPPGSFSVMYWTADSGSHCPINPSWTITVNQRPDADGVYIRGGCPHEGPTPCFCDIYVRSSDTMKAWENALEPYRQEHKVTLPIDPSPSVKVQSSNFTFSMAAWNEPVVGPVVVEPSVGKSMDVTRGDEFTFTVSAFIPAGSESPCADPSGRLCHLTTELWEVRPDGSRRMLRWQFEIGATGKVWLQPGIPAQVSLKGIFPHERSYYPVPKGKAVLVGRWFLWKHYGSLLDYQIPVGSFEVPLNIR